MTSRESTGIDVYAHVTERGDERERKYPFRVGFWPL